MILGAWDSALSPNISSFVDIWLDLGFVGTGGLDLTILIYLNIINTYPLTSNTLKSLVKISSGDPAETK